MAASSLQSIAYWLGRTHPRACLWPTDHERETRAIEVIAYTVGTLHGQRFARIFATHSFSPNQAEHPRILQSGHDISWKRASPS